MYVPATEKGFVLPERTELHISRSKYEMVRQKVLTYWGKVK